MVNAKICKKCGSDEIATKKDVHCRLGYTWECKACDRERSRKYYEKNPERCKEYVRRCREKNPERRKEYNRKYREQNPEVGREVKARRRARKRGVVSTLTAAQWREIQLRFDHRCAYCGERKKLSRDHVTPLNDFGPHTAHNIVPACQSCNSKKHTGPPLVPVQTLLFA